MPIFELRVQLLIISKLGANVVPICSNTADKNHVNSHILIEAAYRALLQGFPGALGKADHSSEFEGRHRSKHAVNAFAIVGTHSPEPPPNIVISKK